MSSIKTHGSESRGQEEAAHASFGLSNHYSKLFIRMVALRIKNALT